MHDWNACLYFVRSEDRKSLARNAIWPYLHSLSIQEIRLDCTKTASDGPCFPRCFGASEVDPKNWTA